LDAMPLTAHRGGREQAPLSRRTLTRTARRGCLAADWISTFRVSAGRLSGVVLAR
jgi:hypothetical protein